MRDVVTQKACRDAFAKARTAIAECRRKSEQACTPGRNIGDAAREVADAVIEMLRVLEETVGDLEKT